MIISARFPAVVAAALALSLMGSAANAEYVGIPIYVSFGFTSTGPVTADTEDLSATTAFITSGPYAVTTTSGSNIGIPTSVTLTSPTPVSFGSPFLKTFMTPSGPFMENLMVTAFTFTGVATGAAPKPSLVSRKLFSTRVRDRWSCRIGTSTILPLPN